MGAAQSSWAMASAPYAMRSIFKEGTVKTGMVKSAIGIGSLLLRGIGDTIRVSLTGNPIEEVKFAKEILKSLVCLIIQ